MSQRSRARLALAAAVFVAALAPHAPRAQAGSAVSLTALDVPYVQDFNTLAASGTSSVLPPGWELAESGANANGLYAAGTGSGNAGDTYSFGPAGSVDRAFGGLQSGSLVPLVGARVANDTGQTITSLEIAYTGEQWRLGALGRVDRIDFQYSLDAASLSSGTWIDVDALDFVAPATGPSIGALDGQAASNRAALSAVVTGLAIPPGASFRIRWVDANAAGADDGLAVDDFTLVPHGGTAVTLSAADVAVAEGDSGTVLASVIVSVSSAMHGGVTFDVATADGPGPAATAGLDYLPRAESAVFIPPGATRYAFDVTVNGDVEVEPDETFLVRLSGVSGALLADAEAVVTIANDDEPPPVSTDVVISQVYGGGGNSGATLTHDFVELFNRGPAAVSLAGWSVQYTSAGGTGTWQVTALGGTIAPGGYYLVQQAAGAGGTTPLPAPDAVGTIALGAGAGKVALQTTTMPIAGACPSAGTADLVGYGGANCFEGMGAAPALANTTAALRKRGGCFDSDHNSVDFAVGNPAPRNSAAPGRSCVPAAASIHEIQGSGPVSPLAGLDVVTTGVVTAIKANGCFLQTPDGAADADPATSQGLFVFTGALPAVAVGDEVVARGTVSEFFGLTQIESSLPGDLAVTTSGASIPAFVTLTPAILDPLGTPDQLERFEGMRVHAGALTSVAPTNEFGEIAAVLAGVPRPLREPGISVLAPVPPDPTSGVPDCCIPRFDENPERILVDSDGLAGSSALAVTSQVAIGSVTGPLDFTFGAYKILPETPPAAGPNVAAAPAPAPLEGEFTVGGFNIENFDGSATRRFKAALAIRQLMRSPDVIGLIEILDQPTLQTLAQQVNDDALAAGESSPGYEAHLVPAPQGGTQNVGFLVKTARLRVDGLSQERAADTFVNPVNGAAETLHDRPPLVLRATVDPAGLDPRPVIVVVNHLRSFIDIELVGGEGARVRAKRKAQAESVAGLLQELQAANPGVPVIAVGDFNAFQFTDGYTDPVATLRGAPAPDDQVVVDESPDLVDPDFVNLTDALPAGERYTFVFQGTPQALDHVLVNVVAAAMVQRYAIARGNADFPEVPETLFSGDPARPERSSDHDMPVAYFRFPPPAADLAVTKTAGAATATAGGEIAYTIVLTNQGRSPAANVVVADALPPGLTAAGCSTTGAGVCGGTAGRPTVTFPWLPAGASEAVMFVAAVSCTVADGASLINAASVTSDTADPDPADNHASVTVAASNPPPVIAQVSASRTHLLLPLHQMVPVTVRYTAADACGPVTTSLRVTSDEAVVAPYLQQGLAGLTAPDWYVVDDRRVLLRSERSSRGDGRVYTIQVEAVDAAGGTARESVVVKVPRFIYGWTEDDVR